MSYFFLKILTMFPDLSMYQLALLWLHLALGHDQMRSRDLLTDPKRYRSAFLSDRTLYCIYVQILMCNL